MARAYRKTPITGMTKADSDERFKKAEHRRERRKLKETDLTGETPADSQNLRQPLGHPKDGKRWYDSKRFPQIM
ncbi:hypothetical protein [Boseongicola sp. H5]|uniref:hypothetical protein n=1 Tax=Boseongicola sp. H5 TaxID=2763261 RepID=UPI001D0A8050|nr:hypothetical protein [Boseongicola sp. H5]